jgi:hypothetical protein
MFSLRVERGWETVSLGGEVPPRFPLSDDADGLGMNDRRREVTQPAGSRRDRFGQRQLAESYRTAFPRKARLQTQNAPFQKLMLAYRIAAWVVVR